LRLSSKAKNLRRVSFTSFLLKTLERLVERFLKNRPLIKHPLAAILCAYREGISTETAFHHLVSKVEVQLQAFSSTSKVAMKQAMIRHEVSEAHVDWVEHMLADRNLTAMGIHHRRQTC
jgi:hypothetical protein